MLWCNIWQMTIRSHLRISNAPHGTVCDHQLPWGAARRSQTNVLNLSMKSGAKHWKRLTHRVSRTARRTPNNIWNNKCFSEHQYQMGVQTTSIERWWWWTEASLVKPPISLFLHSSHKQKVTNTTTPTTDPSPWPPCWNWNMTLDWKKRLLEFPTLPSSEMEPFAPNCLSRPFEIWNGPAAQQWRGTTNTHSLSQWRNARSYDDIHKYICIDTVYLDVCWITDTRMRNARMSAQWGKSTARR